MPPVRRSRRASTAPEVYDPDEIAAAPQFATTTDTAKASLKRNYVGKQSMLKTLRATDFDVGKLTLTSSEQHTDRTLKIPCSQPPKHAWYVHLSQSLGCAFGGLHAGLAMQRVTQASTFGYGLRSSFAPRTPAATSNLSKRAHRPHAAAD